MKISNLPPSALRSRSLTMMALSTLRPCIVVVELAHDSYTRRVPRVSLPPILETWRHAVRSVAWEEEGPYNPKASWDPSPHTPDHPFAVTVAPRQYPVLPSTVS